METGTCAAAIESNTGLADLAAGPDTQSATAVQAARSRRLRLRYWLGSEFQLHFVLLTVFFGLTASTVLGLFLFTTFWQVAMEDLTWRTGSMMPVAVYGKVRSTFLISTVAVGSVITLLSAALSVWITHRVAGPIYGMRRTLAKWLKGDRKARIRLRQNDELQDFADSLNRVADYFEIERETADKALGEAIATLRGREEAWADQLARRLETAISSGQSSL